MVKIITVVGLTGSQGASVAGIYIKEQGWHVRGLTRDPSKPSSQSWADKGVELVKADLNDVSTLRTAFAGSNVIFGVTDFWGVVWDPKAQALAESTGQPINELAYTAEVQQSRNIIDAANSTIGTLDRLKWKYTHNLHFDAKWTGVDYLKATYPALDKKTSYLQVGLYVTNWKKGLHMARPTKQADGTFVLGVPIDGDALVPMVEARQDTGKELEWLRSNAGGKFVKALVQVEPGKNLLGYGSFISWNEFAVLWGKIHGVECRFVRVHREVLENAVPGCVGEELADMFEYIGEFGYDGGDPSVVHPQSLGVDIPVYTVEEYIKGEDWPEVQ
ncbi:hypothetical protein N7516_011478 [Penicillium verrucosum]|uniref:uncharacterized protein n=1 Tax=Penicillium verrucosum TaxID=60171 RepID=UPI00254560C6|nr:uncharacterized protein N7516_011478 [Penicillium verrucosum]KAJ5920620.1 hypothetical protein N7516_011478 [Penicillium verrucosum]